MKSVLVFLYAISDSAIQRLQMEKPRFLYANGLDLFTCIGYQPPFVYYVRHQKTIQYIVHERSHCLDLKKV